MGHFYFRMFLFGKKLFAIEGLTDEYLSSILLVAVFIHRENIWSEGFRG